MFNEEYREKKINVKRNCDSITLTLNKIKIKNFQQWSDMKTDEQMEKILINQCGDQLLDSSFTTGDTSRNSRDLDKDDVFTLN